MAVSRLTTARCDTSIALWQAGRAGRVDHVGQILGPDIDLGGGDGGRRNSRGLLAHVDYRHLASDQARAFGAVFEMSAANIARRPGYAAQDVPQWDVARIERHIGAAGFQHGNERHQHLERSLD